MQTRLLLFLPAPAAATRGHHLGSFRILCRERQIPRRPRSHSASSRRSAAAPTVDSARRPPLKPDLEVWTDHRRLDSDAKSTRKEALARAGFDLDGRRFQGRVRRNDQGPPTLATGRATDQPLAPPDLPRRTVSKAATTAAPVESSQRRESSSSSRSMLFSCALSRRLPNPEMRGPPSLREPSSSLPGPGLTFFRPQRDERCFSALALPDPIHPVGESSPPSSSRFRRTAVLDRLPIFGFGRIDAGSRRCATSTSAIDPAGPQLRGRRDGPDLPARPSRSLKAIEVFWPEALFRKGDWVNDLPRESWKSIRWVAGAGVLVRLRRQDWA